MSGSEKILTGSEFYDQLVSDYDQMINWESRLQRESPFFEKIIADHQINSIVDVACGTGRHCFHFETLGAETIVGVDPAEKTLALARSRAIATGSEIKFIQASFGDVAERVSGRYDIVCVLGNSISHLLTYDDMERCLENFRKLLNERGILLIHLVNWEARIAKQQRFFKPQSHTTSKSEKLFFRFYDFHDELVTMNLAIFQASESPAKYWSHRIISTTLRPWSREVLRMAVADAGLEVGQEFGGMDLSFFNPIESPDYIFTANKK